MSASAFAAPGATSSSTSWNTGGDPVIAALRLPFHFDPHRLRHDLNAVPAGDWSPHYNASDYGGEWRGAALRSGTGLSRDLTAMPPQASTFFDTPLLERCAYFREVLAAFPCPLRAVRLLGLAPGSFIREHTDNALDYEDGLVRIHIPVQTNPGVEFYISGDRVLLEAGRAYYLNVNLPHRVNNRGLTERIHLVIDAEVDEWVRALFARSEQAPRCPAPARGIAQFRDVALADPSIRGALNAIDDRYEFARAAVSNGQAAGFDFHEGDVDAFLRGPAEPGAPGGLPIALSIREGTALAEWIDIGDRPLEEPFFEDTVRACLRRPYVRFSRRTAPLAVPEHACAPRGFIFHMSRCGSTLVSRMLSAASYRVISEAPPIDDAIESGQVEWVRGIVAALGGGAASFVKLDSWHIHALPLIRAAFPETPWLFLYRDPLEVLVSHRRSPGRQAVPGLMDPLVLGLDAAAVDLPRDEWCARALAAMCRSALAASSDPRGLLVDYRELPGAAYGKIARHFGIAPGETAVGRMREAAAADAKNPALSFAPDSAAKQAEGSALRELVARTGLDHLYTALRNLQTP
jgi:Aspartyl/Asparaginyl beta-hydroxylase